MLIRPVTQEWEAWKWALAFGVALALGLIFATVVGAATPGTIGEPGKLPVEIQEQASPMPEVTEMLNEKSLVEARPYVDDAQIAAEVWRILELHRTREHKLAISAWKRLDVPAVTVVWKEIALGHAYLAMEEFDEAERVLGIATEMQPDNALAFYLRGVLRMQQAYLAVEWPETLGHGDTRLVGYSPPAVVPNSRSMYELAATMDFERAIDLAPMTELDALIVPLTSRGGMALEPTVGDLIVALGAEQFPAKSHNALSYLFLKQGALEVAEEHMDGAVAGGLAVVYGYQDLGDEYRARGQHADAARAYLKATKFSSNKMGTLEEAMRSFWDVLVK
jgi:tetratricopeptide (TPR) repeat protein